MLDNQGNSYSCQTAPHCCKPTLQPDVATLLKFETSLFYANNVCCFCWSGAPPPPPELLPQTVWWRSSISQSSSSSSSSSTNFGGSKLKRPKTIFVRKKIFLYIKLSLTNGDTLFQTGPISNDSGTLNYYSIND